MSYIFSAKEAESNSDSFYDLKLHGAILATGQSCQLVWAKFEPGGTYALHSHPHEQMSVMISGQMRLTVGDEVRDIGLGICGAHHLRSGLLSGLRRTRNLPIRVFIKI